ncbi:hypothetical protein CFP56_034166 [Quercus suber]|uniref:Uncharacterized protein n=1 Tax=Quercus suber TaxID=58331 RepID=A0AAW0LSM7_QUESU
MRQGRPLGLQDEAILAKQEDEEISCVFSMVYILQNFVCNMRSGDQNVWIHLDCGIATVEWILCFPTTRIHHLDVFHSDHKAILLILDSEQQKFSRKDPEVLFNMEEAAIRDQDIVNTLTSLVGLVIKKTQQFRCRVFVNLMYNSSICVDG